MVQDCVDGIAVDPLSGVTGCDGDGLPASTRLSVDCPGCDGADVGDVTDDIIQDFAVRAPPSTGSTTAHKPTAERRWLLGASPSPSPAAPGAVVSAVDVIDGENPSCSLDLAVGDNMGSAVLGLGDLDGDSVPDAAVGAPRADTGQVDAGEVHVLLLHRNGSCKASTTIGPTRGTSAAFDGGSSAQFGTSLGLLR